MKDEYKNLKVLYDQAVELTKATKDEILLKESQTMQENVSLKSLLQKQSLHLEAFALVKDKKDFYKLKFEHFETQCERLLAENTRLVLRMSKA